MKKEDVINELIERFGWSDEAVHLGIRAGFKCEYCDRDLLASFDNYDAWQNDHIIPTSKGGSDHPDNIAIVCKTCNFLKRAWVPGDDSGQVGDRKKQVALARSWIRDKRASKERDLEEIRILASQLKES